MVGFHIYVSFPHVTQSLGISLAATFMLCLIHTYNTYLSIHPSIYLAHIWPWINSYRYSLLGDEHPFATDVHQGYMVLTHSHMCVYIYIYIISMSGLIHISPLNHQLRGLAQPVLHRLRLHFAWTALNKTTVNLGGVTY